ncbi:YmgD family protein, partial [Escherichia coli]|uniref:YmgD family protein n=1 Tax=Escherichia coli TaxID=562 RepID=UPI003C76C550
TSKTPSYTKSVSWQHHPKTDSAQVAEIVAVMGNASVASRDLKIEQSPELSAKVVEKLNQVCAKDPQMLLITAIDDTMRAIGKK